MIIFNSPNISFSSDGWKRYKLRRLYFIWVCRDVESFRWFADLLCMLHDKVTGVAWRDANNVINAGYVHTTQVTCYKEYQRTSALPRLPGPASICAWSCISQFMSHWYFIAQCCWTVICEIYEMEEEHAGWGVWVAFCFLDRRQIKKGGGVQFQVDFKRNVAF